MELNCMYDMTAVASYIDITTWLAFIQMENRIGLINRALGSGVTQVMNAHVFIDLLQ